MALILTSTTKKIFKLHPRQYGFKLTFFGVNHAANIWLWPRTWKEHFLKVPRLTLHVSVFDASFHSRLLFTHFVNLVRFHVEPCIIEFFREKLKITTKRYSYKILSFCLRMEISPFFYFGYSRFRPYWKLFLHIFITLFFIYVFIVSFNLPAEHAAMLWIDFVSGTKISIDRSDCNLPLVSA